MSRFLIACSLVAALTSHVATASAQGFAKAPPLDAEARMYVGPRMPVSVVDRATVRAKLLEHRQANLARFREFHELLRQNTAEKAAEAVLGVLQEQAVREKRHG